MTPLDPPGVEVTIVRRIRRAKTSRPLFGQRDVDLVCGSVISAIGLVMAAIGDPILSLIAAVALLGGGVLVVKAFAGW